MSIFDKIEDRNARRDLELIYKRIDTQFNPDSDESPYINYSEARRIWAEMNAESSDEDDKFVTIGPNAGLLLSSREVQKVNPNPYEFSKDSTLLPVYCEIMDTYMHTLTDGTKVHTLRQSNRVANRVGSHNTLAAYHDSPLNVLMRIDQGGSEPLIKICTIMKSEQDLEPRAFSQGIAWLGSTYLMKNATAAERTACMILNKKNSKHYGLITWKGKAYRAQLDSYHNNCDRGDKSEQYKVKHKRKYLIGVEIEKECRKVCDKISAPYLRDRFGWTAERDGSLGSGGYELISPTYNLFDRKGIKKDLLSLSEYINNPVVSDNCGGHINVSFEGMKDGEALFNEIEGYSALLYAMYPNRVNKGYSRARKKKHYRDCPGKDAFYIKRNRLEIRIFPEVKSVECMLQRIELVRYMVRFATTRTDVVAARILNPKSNLYKLLIKMGFVPSTLAQSMLNYSARVDEERFTQSAHDKLKEMGLAVKTQPLYTAKQKKVAIAQIKEWMKAAPSGVVQAYGGEVRAITNNSISRL